MEKRERKKTKKESLMEAHQTIEVSFITRKKGEENEEFLNLNLNPSDLCRTSQAVGFNLETVMHLISCKRVDILIQA